MADNVKYVAAGEKTLASGISSTDTTITLSDLNSRDGTALTMADFGAIGYATLQPNTNLMELISFTGISSTSLTGVTRGLKFEADYTQDTALRKAHAAGSKMVFSNSPQLYDEMAAKDNDETITETWTYTDPNIPRMDAYSAPTDDEQLATKKYVDDIAAGGTATIDRVVPSATAGEAVSAGQAVYFDETQNEWMLADASTAATSENVVLGVAQGSGTDGNSIAGGVLLLGRDSNQSGLVQGDRMYLTDTPGTIGNAAGTVEVEIGHAISATQIDFVPRYDKFITEDQQDALAGTSGTPSNTNKYVTNDDTDDAGTASKVVRYDASSQIDVASTPTDGTHATSKTYVDTEASKKISVSTTAVTVVNTTSEEDLVSFSIPANTLGTNNGVNLEVDIHIDIDTSSANALVFRLKYGTTTIATINGESLTAADFNFDGYLNAVIMGDGATNAQVANFGWAVTEDSMNTLEPNNDTQGYASVAHARGTAAEDSTGNLDFKITVQPAVADTNVGVIAHSYTAFKID